MPILRMIGLVLTDVHCMSFSLHVVVGFVAILACRVRKLGNGDRRGQKAESVGRLALLHQLGYLGSSYRGVRGGDPPAKRFLAFCTR